MNSKLIFPAIALATLAAVHAQPLILQGKSKITVDAEAWSKLPHEDLTATGHDKKEHRYSGVAMAKLLEKIGAPAGDQLRGKAMTEAVLITAADGYQIVFSLAELDASYRSNPVILADAADGKPLEGNEGKLMLIVPGDAKHARWIRQVERIVLVSVQEPAS
ncbi:molybdopterin-dependent oxidoreductase [Luteolibacter pohnpeiensis]|uniref:Molybdopterin-dependent oxidoreductase n=1 Tax=Luteolibacter pohnpeiensis TaxID=454153 RepID=A0A934S515_9BACT|nr:molybdopterin-dependent oxidoreductase [Luteolibacter pohnpeiensis]MBK1881370.1 molybdopterin-dependent oxidoreductase [Luteolibacter pohnpeiensis]